MRREHLGNASRMAALLGFNLLEECNKGVQVDVPCLVHILPKVVGFALGVA